MNFKKRTTPFCQIPLELIEKNPNQPRKGFPQDKLETLAESIERYGILNPLTVRQIGGRYELISGERRYRAAQLLGLDTVPCNVIESNAEQSAEIALAENIVRADLDFFEEAQAMAQLSRMFGLTQEEIAKRVGRTQSAVANKVRLLKLAPKTIEIIRENQLTERHGRALLKLTDPITQVTVAEYICSKGLNVAESEGHIETVIRGMTKPDPVKRARLYTKDVRLVVNAIARHVESLTISGVNAVLEKEDTESCLKITVSIAK